jgi:hypothetical protein
MLEAARADASAGGTGRVSYFVSPSPSGGQPEDRMHQ